MNLGTEPSTVRRRVVITGCGVISPLGNSLDDTWNALIQGRSGVDSITLFDATGLPIGWAAEVEGFDPKQYSQTSQARKALKLMDRKIQFCMGATEQAIQMAQLRPGEGQPWRLACYLGAGTYDWGTREIGETLHRFGLTEPKDIPGFASACHRYLNPLHLLSRIPNMVASHMSLRIDAQGPSNTSTLDCAAGLQAIGEATNWILRGEADRAIAGGADCAITPEALVTLACWEGMLATDAVDPQTAHRPFDLNRKGFVLGEGAGIVLLEEYQLAMERGAPVFAEVIGYGSATDPSPMGTMEVGGGALSRAIGKALENAGVASETVDGVFAGGLATKTHDIAEAAAIRKTLGGETPVTATKGALGNLMAAAGGVDVALAARTIQKGILPVTRNLSNPDPDCHADHVRMKPRLGDYKTLLVTALALSGLVAALILKKV